MERQHERILVTRNGLPLFIRSFTGTLQGTLTTERRGDGGFGYDSIFMPANSDLTFAEMSSEQKNAISHRRLAVEELRKVLGISQ